MNQGNYSKGINHVSRRGTVGVPQGSSSSGLVKALLFPILLVASLGLGAQTAGAAPAPTTQLISGNLFMGTTKVEVGARPNGTFGSNVAAPAGYHPRPDTGLSAGALGFRGNPTDCDWALAACEQISQGDFFVPGQPYEAWALQVGSGSGVIFNTNVTSPITGSFQAIADPNQPAATWLAAAASSGIDVRFDYSVPSFSWLIDANVTLTNNTGAAIDDIYFLRGVDPDNCKADPTTGRPPPPLCTNPGGVPVTNTFHTFNTVISNGPSSGTAKVVATQTDGTYLSLQTASNTAKAFVKVGSFAPSGNLATIWDGNDPAYLSGGPTRLTDEAIYVVEKIPSLAAGASTTLPVKYVIKEGAPLNPTDQTLTVARTGDGTGTVDSDPAGINCGAVCTNAYTLNTLVTLTANPAAGSSFTGWSGACTGTGTCQVTMDQARAVTAEFVTGRTLTVTKTGSGSGAVTSSPAGIDCGPNCSANFTLDSTVTLTANANPGSTFNGWSGAGCSGTGTCTVTMSEARSVTANFSGSVLAVSKTGAGEVVSSPSGIDCGPRCAATFSPGTTVTLGASPAPGYTFAGWGGACSGTGPCEVTLSQNRIVTASFLRDSYQLSVSRPGTGQGTVTSSPSGINCGATCEAPFEEGAQVTLTASAANGSTFTGWSGACSGTGTCQVTMSGARQVTATFTLAEPPRLTITKFRLGPRRLNNTTIIRMAWVECESGTCRIDQAAMSFRARGEPFPGSAIYSKDPFQAGERRLVMTEVPEAVNARLTSRKSGVAILDVTASARNDGLEEVVTRTVRQGLVRCPDNKCR